MRDDLSPLDALLAVDAVLATLLAELRSRDAGRAAPDPAHDASHALRVARWTLALGGLSVDPREAVAAALLHDAVNPPKDSPDRGTASERSADFARERLPALGFSTDSIARIADAIRDHSFSRGAVPASPLGCALQDADRLEALGAIGLLRCISTGVRMGGAWFDADDPWAEARPLDDARFSVDHCFTKLLELPATMRTEAGRAEAERRAAFLREFLARLGDELGRPAPAKKE
ncbi:MAG TPA: HD domain-containing protein [Candidatus Eisenbacteria bacterium]